MQCRGVEGHLFELRVLYLLLLHAQIVNASSMLCSPVLVDRLPYIFYEWLYELFDNPVLSLLPFLPQLVQLLSAEHFFLFFFREITNIHLDVTKCHHTLVGLCRLIL